jgi:hypothetical protein
MENIIEIKPSDLMHIIEQVVYKELNETIGFSSYSDIACECSAKIMDKIKELTKIPNVIPTPTEKKFTSEQEIKEMLEKGLRELESVCDAEVKIAPPTVLVDYENAIR